MELVEQIREELFSLSSPTATIREQDLMEKFKVSRTSVREALKQLEVDNLIERRRNVGTCLHQFTPREISETYDMRALLEGYACHLAALKVTSPQLDQLTELASAYRALEIDPTASHTKRVAADDRFHHLILEIANHDLLSSMMHRFDIMRRAFAVYAKPALSQPSSTPYSHQRIVEALRNGDCAAAENLMRNHCLWAKRKHLEQVTGISIS